MAKVVNDLISRADAKMTEEVREALMRLTMCAREECAVCKYKDECGYDFQYKISTDNMNTLSDALMRSRCEVDAKSAEAVQGCDGCRYDTRIPQKQCLRCKRYWRDSYERKGGDTE